MARPSWAPGGMDLDQPSVARVYDYFLGGSHNFAADRAFAEQILGHMPELVGIIHENRAFLRRAVRHLCDLGIRQFIDLGSGIPTVGNVHEIAQEYDPECRIVYVDLDPVAVAHSRALLESNPRATIVAADLRRPAEILDSPDVRKLIDFSRPVAVLLVAVVHFLKDSDDPAKIISRYVDEVAPGSYLALSHAALTRSLTSGEEQALAAYRTSASQLVLRTVDEIRALFGDLTLIEPGLVSLPHWRPDDEPSDGEPSATARTSMRGVPAQGVPAQGVPAQGVPAQGAREVPNYCGIGRKD